MGSMKKVLAEVSLASLLAAAWIASCYLVATLAASLRTQWWETEAWRAWWVALPLGAAFLAAGLVASYSERLGADRPARILLRSTLVSAVSALGLTIQAMLPPRLTPGDFFLSYQQPGSGSVPMVLAGTLAVASVLLAVTLKSRARVGSAT